MATKCSALYSPHNYDLDVKELGIYLKNYVKIVTLTLQFVRIITKKPAEALNPMPFIDNVSTIENCIAINMP